MYLFVYKAEVFELCLVRDSDGYVGGAHFCGKMRYIFIYELSKCLMSLTKSFILYNTLTIGLFGLIV